MSWICFYCKKKVTQDDTAKIECPHCHKTGSDGWAVEEKVSKKTIKRIKKAWANPIDALEVSTQVKKALKAIRRGVVGAWKDIVKDLRYRLKVESYKVKLLEKELSLANKEIRRLEKELSRGT